MSATQLNKFENGLLDININIQIETNTTDDMMFLAFGSDGSILLRVETPSDMHQQLENLIEEALKAVNLHPNKMVII